MTARGGRSIWLLLGHTSGASAAASSFSRFILGPDVALFSSLFSLSLVASYLIWQRQQLKTKMKLRLSLSLPCWTPILFFGCLLAQGKKTQKGRPPNFFGEEKDSNLRWLFFSLSLDGGPLLCNVRVRRTHLRCTRTHTRQIRTTRKQDDAAAAAADATFKKRREECVVLRFGGGRPRQVHSRAPSSIIEKNQKNFPVDDVMRLLTVVSSFM